MHCQRIGIGHRVRGLYQLQQLYIPHECFPFGHYTVGVTASDVWHYRHGNIGGP